MSLNRRIFQIFLTLKMNTAMKNFFCLSYIELEGEKLCTQWQKIQKNLIRGDNFKTMTANARTLL